MSETRVIAFTAASVNTGRTSMVANVASLLANEDRRVLVIDLGSERPSVHHYMRFAHPADSGEALDDRLAAAVRRLVTPRRDSEETPTRPLPAPCLHSYHSSGRERIDVLDFRGADGSAEAALAALDVDEVAEVRAGLRSAGYDEVLLDLPTNSSSEPARTDAAEVTTRLADAVVVCFTTRHDVVEAASRLAKTMLDTVPARTMVATASMYEGGQPSVARRDRTVVHAAFRDLVEAEPGSRRVRLIEVPYEPRHSEHRTLAVLATDFGSPDRLSTAYREVTAAVTGGAVATRRAIPERFIRGYRLAFGFAEPSASDVVWLAYQPKDRQWADWVAAQVRRCGVRVRRLLAKGGSSDDSGGPVPGNSVVAIYSSGFDGSPLHSAVTAADQDSAVHVVTILVDPTMPRANLPRGPVVDATGLDETTMAGRLLAALLLFAQPEAASATVSWPVRTLGGATMVAEDPVALGVAEAQAADATSVRPTRAVPTRNPRFVGREHDLELLRDELCPLDADTGAVTVQWSVVSGPPGIGKSEIAREYANRFSLMYDDVWWIPATDRESVRDRLATLARTCGLDLSGDVAATALAYVSGQGGPRRWLLVYDNATDQAISGMLPAFGPVDVLITTSERLPSVPDEPMAVDALNRSDCLAMLTGSRIGLADLPRADAERIADLLDRLPIAVQLATTWLRQIAASLRKEMRTPQAAEAAGQHLLERLQSVDASAAPSDSVDQMVRLNAGVLRELPLGPVAVTLAEMCSFLSSDGVTLNLLRSRDAVAALAEGAGQDGSALVADEAEIDRVLRKGSLLGLFEVDHGPATLRMHREVQRALRDTMPVETLLERQALVLRALAGYAPQTPSAQDSRAAFAELYRHIEPSGAVEADYRSLASVLGDAATPGSTGWQVRRWLVEHVRHLYVLGAEAWETAQQLGERLDKSWDGVFDDTDPLRGRLIVQRANLLRELGPAQIQQAELLDRPLLAMQRAHLGVRHPRTLTTAQGLGGDLRALGRFEEALAEDEATLRGFNETYGQDHPRTLMVAYNLVRSRLLMGRVRQALQLEERSYRHRLRVLGRNDVFVWQSRRSLATCLAELGLYQEAHRLLCDNLDVIRDGHEPHTHPEDLRTTRVLLTVERRASLRELRLIRKEGRDNLERHVTRFGPDHRFTRSTRMSYAVDLNAAGDRTAAVDMGSDCLGQYVDAFGEKHPYSSVCRTNLVLFQRASGQLNDALRNGRLALDQLRNVLDDQHPWALRTAVNHAMTLAISGDLDEAKRLTDDTVVDCQENLGPGHPTTLAAERIASQLAGSSRAVRSAWEQLDTELMLDVELN